MERARALTNAKRIVVKVGTASITEDLVLSETKVGRLASELSALRSRGLEVIIVSSGAIAAGIRCLGLKERPRDIDVLQATAAVGQTELMKAWGAGFASHGTRVAQILLTRDDFQSRARYLKIRSTVGTLLRLGAVPIINENDSVAVEEIKFGDNDTLSALVASGIDADLLVLMSSMDGLYDRDPAREAGAKRISVVERMTDDISSLTGKSRLGGVGGISAKVKAGGIMMGCGIPMAIVDAGMSGVLSRLLAGEPVGTVFLPDEKRENKQQWMLYASAGKGVVYVDGGAAKMLQSGKASLLPSGITKIKGIFRKGDSVKIVDAGGTEFARGITNFGSEELEAIMGRKSAEIEALLSRKAPKEAVHRDNMVLLGR